jgi:hypothetical protein
VRQLHLCGHTGTSDSGLALATQAPSINPLLTARSDHAGTSATTFETAPISPATAATQRTARR